MSNLAPQHEQATLDIIKDSVVEHPGSWAVFSAAAATAVALAVYAYPQNVSAESQAEDGFSISNPDYDVQLSISGQDNAISPDGRPDTAFRTEPRVNAFSITKCEETNDEGNITDWIPAGSMLTGVGDTYTYFNGAQYDSDDHWVAFPAHTLPNDKLSNRLIGPDCANDDAGAITYVADLYTTVTACRTDLEVTEGDSAAGAILDSVDKLPFGCQIGDTDVAYSLGKDLLEMTGGTLYTTDSGKYAISIYGDREPAINSK